MGVLNDRVDIIMNKNSRINKNFILHIILFLLVVFISYAGNRAIAGTEVLSKDNPAINQAEKKLVYLVSDSRIPFWEIMGRGIKK